MINNSRDLKRTFARQRILVTGGTGSIGREIVSQLVKYQPKFIRVYSRDESKHFELEKKINRLTHKKILRSLIGDIRDKDRLSLALEDIDIIFHVAALKHVPYCEYNPFEAIKTNILGAQNLIDLAIKNKIKKVIAISTDKAVYPNTVMGISKLMMERLMVAAHNYKGRSATKFTVVRFGNVLNSKGSVIPTWLEQIKNQEDVTVTDKRMKRFFMSIPQAVALVFKAASIMKGREVIVLKMKKRNIYQLAQKIIQKFDKDKKVKIKIIGARDKEKMDEELFTGEEAALMIENKYFYIILPDIKTFKSRRNYYQI